ncbi:MAG: hypothetical protein V2A63_00300 [Patescibacteria group bacterium]
MQSLNQLLMAKPSKAKSESGEKIPKDQSGTAMNVFLPSPDRAVPKLCTSANFAQLKSGNIVVSFFSRDVSVANQAVLIERIIIEKEHAKDIVKKLSAMAK